MRASERLHRHHHGGGQRCHQGEATTVTASPHQLLLKEGPRPHWEEYGSYESVLSGSKRRAISSGARVRMKWLPHASAVVGPPGRYEELKLAATEADTNDSLVRFRQ